MCVSCWIELSEPLNCLEKRLLISIRSACLNNFKKYIIKILRRLHCNKHATPHSRHHLFVHHIFYISHWKALKSSLAHVVINKINKLLRCWLNVSANGLNNYPREMKKKKLWKKYVRDILKNVFVFLACLNSVYSRVKKKCSERRYWGEIVLDCLDN